jgi:hypothetical protein
MIVVTPGFFFFLLVDAHDTCLAFFCKGVNKSYDLRSHCQPLLSVYVLDFIAKKLILPGRKSRAFLVIETEFNRQVQL